jgi:hypothetical protein
MSYHEASGRSLSREKEKAQLHHLTISPSSTSEHPGWTVARFKSERGSPVNHEFNDGHELLAHVANSLGIPEPENEEN